MDYKSQNEKILNYLRKNKKGITSMKAFWRFRITRLSARIYDLREKGKHIITVREANIFNDGYHARYVLVKDKEWWE